MIKKTYRGYTLMCAESFVDIYAPDGTLVETVDHQGIARHNIDEWLEAR